MNPEPILIPDEGTITALYVNGKRVLDAPSVMLNSGDALSVSYSLDADGNVRDAALIVTPAKPAPWWRRLLDRWRA